MSLITQTITLINRNPKDSRIPGMIRQLKGDDRKAAEDTLKKALSIEKGIGETSKESENLKGLLAELGNQFVEFKGGANEAEIALYGAAKAIAGKDGSFAEAFKSLATPFQTAIKNVESYRISLNQFAVKDSRQFIVALRQQQDTLRDYGITFNQLTKATEEIRENLNELTSKTFANNEKSLTKLLVVNEKFGVSQGQSIELLNNLFKGFNISGQGADRFSRTLLNFARQTGQPFTKVFRDFNGAVDQFFVTLDSDKALKRFTVFQQTARTLGTSVNSLVGVVDKFDDLQTGFQTGGQLNMLLSNLGGAFDAQRAIMMTRPERLRYLAETVAGVGGRIRGMSELGQRAIIRQLSQTTGFDIATIRGFIDKGIGQDLDSLIQKSDSLTAMTAREQKRLADENTTRAQKQQQVSDRFINENTVALEANAQAIARFTTDLEQKFITSLGQYTDALVNLVKVQTASGVAAAQNVFAPAIRTTGGRRAAINPGPNRGG